MSQMKENCLKNSGKMFLLLSGSLVLCRFEMEELIKLHVCCILDIIYVHAGVSVYPQDLLTVRNKYP